MAVIALGQPRSSVNPAVAVPILDLFTDKEVVLSKASPNVPWPASINTSPVRFTWDAPYRLSPGAGLADAGRTAAVAIISDGARRPLPDSVLRRVAGYDRIREFAVSDRVFRYKTIVTIYGPSETAGGPVSIMR